jgi:S-DNA-T family DNA segregation ATPase FtsK/SpoIIIE
MALAASSTATRPGRDGAKRNAPPPRPYGVDPGANRFASPAIRAAVSRRLAEISGLAMAMAGIFVFVTLITYNPRDPSLNTATSQHATNLGGPVGSILADFLLQGFGCAGGLPGLAMLIWAWRIASRRGIGHFAIRVFFTLLLIPTAAMMLSALHGSGTWPTAAGLGGAGGHLLDGAATEWAQPYTGAASHALVTLLGMILSAAFLVGSLGLSWGEWRRAGAATMVAAQAGAKAGAVAGSWGTTQAAGLVARTVPSQRSYSRPPPGAIEDDEDDDGPALADLARQAAMAPRTAPPALKPTAQAPVLAKPDMKPRVAMPEKKSVFSFRQETLPLEEAGWRYPPLSLLKSPPARAASGPSEESLQNNARLLESVLADYGVQGAIRDIRPGPVVTLYELEPAPGIRSARVIGLADDVARSLSVTAVRIATVPGRNVIGIEVPNQKRETVFLSELLGNEAFERNAARLPLALGKDIGGSPIVSDLARMPHLLIAGTTGSGKSVGINAMILSLLFKLPPDQCRLILIDPKMLELSVYEGIPHLMAPVVTEPAKAVSALKWTVREMERRYRAMSQLGVRNVGGYNERVEEARTKGEVISRRVQTGYDSETGKPTFEEQPLTLEPLPFIVVVIDEMADLMMVAGKDIEAAVQRLAQMARAAGIHVIMATQRPSVDVITGTIKANFPTRISFQVISKFDSRTILGEQGAEQLLGHGDLLYMMGGGRITRVHGPLVTDREVEDVVAFLRSQGEPAYLDEVTDVQDDDKDGGTGGMSFSGIAGAGEGEQGLFDQAVAVVAREGKASTSFIQRHLQIGYNRAAKLIEQMEKEGIVSPANHVGKREVLVRRTED